jgi:hypothetical protein
MSTQEIGFRIGQVQQAAIEIYVLDQCVVDGSRALGEAVFDGYVMDDHVWIAGDRLKEAHAALIDAINSADDDGDHELRSALEQLSKRVCKAAYAQ